ncbi:MAG: hypothetical protein HRU41_12950 [Saprospiraceae bacterium]|nr:hypothetical protein [Saprospiraceae bacterium]
MNLNSISIIIPTLNEEERIGSLIKHLRTLSHQAFLEEIIVSDGGDQTLFLPKETFEALGRFDENLPIMEDFDFVWRAKKQYPLHFVKNPVLVSARKYERNSYLKVQIINGITFTLFRRGYCPFKLAKWYKRVLS